MFINNTKRYSKDMIKKVIIVVSMLIVTAIGFKSFHSASEDAVPASKNTPAIQGIGALGSIEPRSRVIKLSHDAGPEGARIEKWQVKEGDTVKQNDILAYFSDYERKQSKLSVAEAEISVLEAKLRSEKANYIFVKEDYARVGQLLKVKAISQKEMQDKKRNYDQSKAMIDSAEAELESAKASLVLARQELKQTFVAAPIAGTILKIHAWPGERVSDKGVVDIADISTLDVVAEIYERDMPRVRQGQKAEIHVAGFDKAFTGEVYQLGYMVNKNDLNNTDPLADRDNRVVEVRIALPKEVSSQLQHLLYMQVDVRIDG